MGRNKKSKAALRKEKYGLAGTTRRRGSDLGYSDPKVVEITKAGGTDGPAVVCGQLIRGFCFVGKGKILSIQHLAIGQD